MLKLVLTLIVTFGIAATALADPPPKKKPVYPPPEESASVGVLGTLIMTRFLDPDIIGEVSVASILCLTATWLTTWGVGQYVIVNFPQSKYDGDALALMAESYKRLGDTKLSDDAKRVLQQNHPEHPWLAGNWPHKPGL